MSIALAIFILFIVVVIHEFGHFVTSVIFGIRVKGLYLGLPMRWSLKTTLGKYPLYITPLMIGAGVDVDKAELRALAFWKQTVILLSGVGFNILSMTAAAMVLFGPMKGLEISVFIIWISIAGIAALLSGALPGDTMAGPVGIVAVSGGFIEASPEVGPLFIFIAISAALAITNILPIPGLDGGQVVVRFLVRKGLPQRWADRASVACLVFLIGSMVILTLADVGRLITDPGWIQRMLRS